MDDAVVKLSRDQHVWSVDAQREPVAVVGAVTVIEIETWDCFTGQVQSEEDTLENIDLGRELRDEADRRSRRRARRHPVGDPDRHSTRRARRLDVHTRMGSTHPSGPLADHSDLPRERRCGHDERPGVVSLAACVDPSPGSVIARMRVPTLSLNPGRCGVDQLTDMVKPS